MPQTILEQMTNSLKELVAIESVLQKAEQGAPFGKECRRALDYALDLGKKFGFKTQNVDGYAGHIEYGSGAKILGILGHLDVVPAGSGWDSPPFELTEKEGILYGRGVADDKGGFIACLYALKALKDEGFLPKKTIRLIAGCNEESGSECMKYYKTKQKLPDITFVPDADFPVVNSEKGILRLLVSVPLDAEQGAPIFDIKGGTRVNMVAQSAEVVLLENSPFYAQALQRALADKKTFFVEQKELFTTIKASGKSAHAMCPQNGINAISKIASLFSGVKGVCKAQNDFAELCAVFEKPCLASALEVQKNDDESGNQTINLGLVCLEKNILKLTLDCRCPLSQNIEQMIQKIQAKLPTNAKIETQSYVKNLYVDKHSFLIKTLLQVYGDYTKTQPQPLHTGGGTYAREFENAVAFGPTFEHMNTRIHDANENYPKQYLQKLFDIYKAAIMALSQTDEV